MSEEAYRIYHAPDCDDRDERQRRLDIFAAAALAGLMSSKTLEGFNLERITLVAWCAARAMIDNEPNEES
jgi:hypothetical protein